jgi:hypothetical protein
MQNDSKAKKSQRTAKGTPRRAQRPDTTRQSMKKPDTAKSESIDDDADINFMRFTSTPTGSMSQFNMDNYDQSMLSKSRTTNKESRMLLVPKPAKILFQNTKVFPDNFHNNNYGKWMMEVVQRKRVKANYHLTYPHEEIDQLDTTKDSNKIVTSQSSHFLKTNYQTTSYATECFAPRPEPIEFKRTFTVFEPVFHPLTHRSTPINYYYSTAKGTPVAKTYYESTDIFRPFRQRGTILKSVMPRENQSSKWQTYYDVMNLRLNQLRKNNPYDSIYIDAKSAIKYVT